VFKEDFNDWVKEHVAFHSFMHAIAYNDEPPGHKPVSSTYAHAKGVLLWNDQEILWLVHSVPKWPCISIDEPRSYFCCCVKYKYVAPFDEIDESERLYGQSFIIYRGESNKLDCILHQLLGVMNVYVYFDSSHLTETWKRDHVSHDATSILQLNKLTIHLAKNGKEQKDFYEDILLGHVSSGCIVESWMRPSMPETDKVKHIKTICFENGKYSMKETTDHSKWAVSDSPQFPWILIGDLNRMTSQRQRGGGGILVYDEELWHLFSSIIGNRT